MMLITVQINHGAPLFQFGILNTGEVNHAGEVRYEIYRMVPVKGKQFLAEVWHLRSEQALVLANKALSKICETPL